MLRFDNRLLQELPGEADGSAYPHEVRGAFWSPISPAPSPSPQWLAHSPEMANLLGLDVSQLTQPAWLNILAGNALAPGMTHYATNYGGHQFGTWAGQLGDGRAIFLGEALGPDGRRFEMQLKGVGRTPYSRRGDGRAVLRSSIREFLCSEAMHHLGVPTTRALSLVASGESVTRDMFYDGHPRAEPGAIVCRVSPSFIRFGHFELPAARGERALLRRLVSFTIARDFPAFTGNPEANLHAWFAEVCRRTACLVVDWMRLGFVHGVLNTDNMSILGLTIDYGPYGWLDDFDPGWTPNTTDALQRRYCFARQPEIARWNLERLADALSILVPGNGGLHETLAVYDETYVTTFQTAFAAKFGFRSWRTDDADLVETAFTLLHRAEIDMTIFFRRLSELDLATPRLETLDDAFYSRAKVSGCRAELESWLRRWASRVAGDNEDGEQRRMRMLQVNPRFVFRNYLAQQAIDLAEQGDLSLVHTLQSVLRRPYDDQPEHDALAAKRPDWAREKPGCSMLSCSS